MSNVNDVTVTGRIVHLFQTNNGCIVTLSIYKNHPKFICFQREAEYIMEHYSVGMIITLSGFVVSSCRGRGKYEQCIFCREVLPTPEDSVSFRNDFVLEGVVTSICRSGEYSKFALLVNDDGHTAILQFNALTQETMDITLGNKLTVRGYVTTKCKEKYGIKHFYQNFVGLRIVVHE